MTKEEAHKLIDELFDLKEKQPAPTSEGITTATSEAIPVEPKRELPKDKRVVRTKSSGNIVYLLDEIKKTRQWVTSPKILEQLGFQMADVKEVEDNEMLKYQMSSALYRVDNGQA